MHVKDKSLANDTNLVKFDYIYPLVYQIFCDARYKPVLKVAFSRFTKKGSIKACAERSCCSGLHSRIVVMLKQVTQK